MLVGVADWPAYFGILLQGTAAAGAVIFALIASWVFGGEFSNRTAKELLALPTSRATIVSAKIVLLALWDLGLALLLFVIGLVVGSLLDIPGWSIPNSRQPLGFLMLIAFLTFMLMPLVALWPVPAAVICRPWAGRSLRWRWPRLQPCWGGATGCRGRFRRC